MSEQAVEEVPATGAAPTEEAPKPKPTETVEFWKQKAREQETRAKANADAAQRLQQIEESQKTEAQKLVERAEAAERERDALRVETLRVRVAATKGLPPGLASRLQGATVEELAADADALLASVGRPRGNADQGARPQSSQAPDMNSLIRRAAGLA